MISRLTNAAPEDVSMIKHQCLPGLVLQYYNGAGEVRVFMVEARIINHNHRMIMGVGR